MVFQSRTRAQVRQSIGYNLIGGRLHVSSATSTTDTTSVIDTSLRGGDDNYIGWWVIATSGNNDGEITRVSDYDASATDLTVSPAFTNTVTSGDTYELWPDDYPPAMIHEFINQAISEASNRAFNWQEDRSLHLHSDQYRYAIPTTLDVITGLEFRSRVISTLVDGGESAWTALTSTTATADTEVKRRGASSSKLVVVSGESQNTNLAQVTVQGGNIDVNKYDTLEWWSKASIALTAADFRFTFEGGTGLSAVDWPAHSADTWTHNRVSLTKVGGASSDITAIKLNYNGSGAMSATTFWIDEIRLVDATSGQWQRISSNQWYVDRENREIVFTERPPYALLKIRGGDKIALPTADSDTLEVDDHFVVSKATSLAFQASSLGPNNDPELRRQQVAAWEQRANQAKRRFQPLVNARMVS